MKDIAGYNFTYGGRGYEFSVTLYTNDGKQKVPLDNKAMQYFEFSSELNRIVHAGSFVYVDAYGVLDAFLEQQGAYCEVGFREMLQQRDGETLVEEKSEQNAVFQNFMVESVEILGRDKQNITYKVSLLGNNIYKALKTIDFSNYEGSPQPVFDIVKSCLRLAGFGVDDKSFKRVKSGVMLNYATNGNDNALSVLRYLLNKLYYYRGTDVSLKYVFYNETSDAVQLYDIGDAKTFSGYYSVVLSPLKSQCEGLVQQEETKLATVTRFPGSRNMRGVFNQACYDYSYEDNLFSRQEFTSKSIANYINATYDAGGSYVPKQKPLSDVSYRRRSSYWNNSINVYGDATMSLTDYNSLVVEIDGDILCKPAALVGVSVDRNSQQIMDESVADLDDLMTRYGGLEGAWITSKVQHLIYPAAGKYRQVLVLFRNYTKKI